MIESISLSDIASYNGDAQNLTDLSEINYIFGSNGSGKTTISRVIEDVTPYPSCLVKWKNDVTFETLVYNQKFVERNFNQSEGIKGIFTLGEDNVEIEKAIEEQTKGLSELKNKISSLNRELNGEDGSSGKYGELIELEQKFEERCWAQKIKYDGMFKDAFTGYRNNKSNFKRKILEESSSNSANVKPLEYLKNRAETIFDQNLVIELVVNAISAESVIQHEDNPILERSITGKKDVDIARIIGKLNNSDWVKKGRSYLEQNDGICPFCQQRISDNFSQSLNEYFDETYAEDIAQIEDLLINYQEDSTKLLADIDTLIESYSNYLDLDYLNTQKELLSSLIDANIRKIEDKMFEPSRIIELETIEAIVSVINALINSANKQICEHNRICDNIEAEKKELTSLIWKYLLETELKDSLEDYHNNQKKLNVTIKKIEVLIASANDDIREKGGIIRNLETQVTSLIPTKDEINALLLSFGFQIFSLDIADGSYYKLVRQDGTDATETLSEGEKSFLTFLYFYHLLKGSQLESGIATDRIVVFDDPVSSLDSDILFIVSSLIKGILHEVRSNLGHIKQIFVMTHNVYFHKEITFNSSRHQGNAMKDETFWIVRKFDSGSKLVKYACNPIKTSYDLLWDEIRNPNRSPLTIQNTIRRILENYFTILGGCPLRNLPDKFEGRNKIICGSMLSFHISHPSNR